MSLNTLFELYMKSKKQMEYQKNLLLKKGKTITTETLHLIRNVYEDDNCSRQVPEKKDYVSMTIFLCNLPKPLQLARIIPCFQRKTPKCKYCVLKVLSLRPKLCVLASSKMTHCVCFCSAHQNVVLLVDAMHWYLTHKDMIKLTSSCPLKFIRDHVYITIIHKSIF